MEFLSLIEIFFLLSCLVVLLMSLLMMCRMMLWLSGLKII